MAHKGLNNFFEGFLKKENLFLNKKILQSTYTPGTIVHRDEQVKVIADIIAPALRMDRPSNIFVYGKTGTGKTLTVKYTSKQMLEVAEKNEIPLKVLYINCKLKRIADTEYRLIAQLSRDMGKSVPATGLPTDEVYKIFFSAIDSKKQIVLLILDEIDQLVKKTGDEILYNLVRINEELEQSQICIIGVSNDLMFVDTLDPRVKSSLSEEEIIFPPYNALQIQDILHHRVKRAFRDGVLEQGVISKCAAYAAREHGDARRALELIRVAGELAERNLEKTINISHIDQAEEKIEKDRVIDILRSQPKQIQVTLYSILSLCEKETEAIFTGEVYELYKKLCDKTNLRPLTQRRLSDIISELDMLGIINAKVISKGRYGRTREISVPSHVLMDERIKKKLSEQLYLS